MFFFVLCGILLIALTFWDLARKETDTVFIFEHWWEWIDINRSSFPIAYWLVISIQFSAGAFLIIYGIVA